jgi:hypothetical protein
MDTLRRVKAREEASNQRGDLVEVGFEQPMPAL